MCILIMGAVLLQLAWDNFFLMKNYFKDVKKKLNNPIGLENPFSSGSVRFRLKRKTTTGEIMMAALLLNTALLSACGGGTDSKSDNYKYITHLC